MQPTYDPEHGELRSLIGHLTAVEADMMASDLRALQIPAVGRKQTLSQIDEETGETVEWVHDRFEIVVPDAFFEISEQVLEATHLKREGDVPDAWIERELLADADTDPLDPLGAAGEDPAWAVADDAAGESGADRALAGPATRADGTDAPSKLRTALVAFGFLLIGAAIAVILAQR